MDLWNISRNSTWSYVADIVTIWLEIEKRVIITWINKDLEMKAVKRTYVRKSIGAPAPSKARTGWNWFSSFFYGTRLPLGQRGATQKMKCTAYLCSSLSQRQSCPIPKWGASVLRGSSYGENCVRDEKKL